MSQVNNTAQDPIRDEAYNALEKEIKEHLIRQLEMGKMTVKQVAEVCFILGHARTAQGLQFLIDNLVKDYPVIEEIKDEQENAADQSVDQVVQKYVSYLIKTDPLKATEVGARASAEGVTLTQLIQEFPEIEKY